ncbi:unnamed protein product [Ostreobium quekettii]|uniref:Uncharacterized protein n=1 Tax=Ostreobium quekettii TaxID=121088 RepID=A0A8S1IMN4_9CHLO|nr:unnamed protein product [Ostreobium quekettii]
MVASWGGAVEVIQWGSVSEAAGLAVFSSSQRTRRTVLLGMGVPLRSIAAGPCGSIVATVDAELSFHTGRASPEDVVQHAISTEKIVNHLELDEDPIDLRGRWDQSNSEVVRCPAQVPEALILDHFVDRTVPPARLCVFWLAKLAPPANVKGTFMQEFKPMDSATGSFQMKLPFAIPDVLHVHSRRVFVSSRHSPPLVGIFEAEEAGLAPVTYVELAPNCGDGHRLRCQGLCTFRDGRRYLAISLMANLQAPSSVFMHGCPAALRISCHDITEHVAQEEDEMGAHGMGPVAHESLCPGDANAGVQSTLLVSSRLSQIMSFLSSFQEHVDNRLDKIDETLGVHSRKLAEIERILKMKM